MKKNIYFRSAATVFLLLTIALTTTAFVDKYYYVDKKLLAIESVIESYYVGDVEVEKLREGIYKGFVSGVGDVYTNYYTADEYDSFQQKTSGVYTGIGIQMTVDQKDNTILVTNVFEGSPAEEAGLQADDRIIKAGGKTVSGDDYSIIPTLVKGEENTTVDITVYRPADERTYDFTVTRQNVIYPSVSHKIIEEDLGYIKIDEFEKLTYDQFKEALTAIEDVGAKGLILDLRGNPGGRLDVTEKIADELVPEGLIVSTQNKEGKGEEYYADDKYTDIPIVVIVNGSSASASEVLTGALRDHNRAKIVGETTFGKGVVQSIIPLNDGSALKVTTAKYFTPSGECIQGIGIDPDYKVSLSVEALMKAKLSEEEDVQLQTAVKVLREQIS